jgi:hypothetical protein
MISHQNNENKIEYNSKFSDDLNIVENSLKQIKSISSPDETQDDSSNNESDLILNKNFSNFMSECFNDLTEII